MIGSATWNNRTTSRWCWRGRVEQTRQSAVSTWHLASIGRCSVCRKGQWLTTNCSNSSLQHDFSTMGEAGAGGRFRTTISGMVSRRITEAMLPPRVPDEEKDRADRKWRLDLKRRIDLKTTGPGGRCRAGVQTN